MKKLLSLILCTVILLSLSAFSVFAEGYTISDALAILKHVVGAELLTDEQKAR